jgi:hypothetical protein
MLVLLTAENFKVRRFGGIQWNHIRLNAKFGQEVQTFKGGNTQPYKQKT